MFSQKNTFGKTALYYACSNYDSIDAVLKLIEVEESHLYQGKIMNIGQLHYTMH